MPVLLGQITPEQYAVSTPKHISRFSELKAVQDGDVIEFLGHAMIYDSAKFITKEELDGLGTSYFASNCH